MRYRVECMYLGTKFFIECVAGSYDEAKRYALIQNPNATILNANRILWIMPINLNIYELDAIKSALQLLSKKEQKLMESSGKVSYAALYNKIVSYSEQLNVW